jgi:N-formylmaleamate deformylase
VLAQNYDVVLPDARGHGLSDAPPTGYATSDHVADLAGLVRQLGLNRPALMGHSMGGTIVAGLAVQHPDLVGRCVLEDPVWIDPETERGQEELSLSPEARQQEVAQRRADIERQKSQTREQIMAAGWAQNPGWDEAEFGPWVESKIQVSPHAALFAVQPMPDWREVAPRLACPTLLVMGDAERGGIVTANVARGAQALNPLIQVAHISGVGHNIRREGFEAYMQAVTKFVSAK